ncbi:MAG: hypothetical protein MN733_10590 [Nitrososphaera sp.]|nr:hypothetical protein [Nitrososphaera sp.]
MNFEVNLTSTHVRYFQITYEENCGSVIRPVTWVYITTGDGVEIINNTFLISFPGRGFTGTFTSDVTSTGTFNVNYYDDNLGEWCQAAGSWTAVPEAMLSFKTFLPVLVGYSE